MSNVGEYILTGTKQLILYLLRNYAYKIAIPGIQQHVKRNSVKYM